MDLIVLSDPGSVLDIGVGFGKYGFLSREYLELWDGKDEYNKWKRRIDGIEAFPQYLTPVHSFIYDKIYKGNALDILPKIKRKYDLIIIIDVLEHFTKKDGIRLLKECKKISDNILISTPHDIGDQEDCFDNPYEIHRYEWKTEDIDNVFTQTDKKYVSNIHSVIGFFGPDVSKINAGQKENSQIIREKKYPITSIPRRIAKKVKKKLA